MTSSNMPLPTPVVIFRFFTAASAILAAVSFGLSFANLLTHPIDGTNNSPWFDMVVSAITLIFHGASLVFVLVRVRRAKLNRKEEWNSEKGMGMGAVLPRPQKGLYHSWTMITWITILSAFWVVATAAMIYETLVRGSWTLSEKGQLAVLVTETLVMCALTIYALLQVRSVGNKVSGNALPQGNLKEKFPFEDMPRPLLLNLKPEPSAGKERITMPSLPPMTFPATFSSASMTDSPSPPLPALHPDPISGLRTLVLVDPRMGISYHGSLDRSSA